MQQRVRVSARVGRTLHRALLRETWRRQDLQLPGATLGELVDVAVELVPDDLDTLEVLLRSGSCRRALAEKPEVQMQPRVHATTADRIRIMARSLSFYGQQVTLVTDQQVLVAVLADLLATEPDAYDPYQTTRRRRPAQQRRDAEQMLTQDPHGTDPGISTSDTTTLRHYDTTTPFYVEPAANS